MDISTNEKPFSTPPNSQTSQWTSSGKEKSHLTEPGGRQTKVPTTAARQPPQPSPTHQQGIYPITPDQFASSLIPPGQEAFYPMFPGPQMSDATSSGKESSHPTLDGQRSPTTTALLQRAPLPDLLGRQLPSPIPRGPVFYYPSPTRRHMKREVLSDQQVTYPMTPGQQVTYSSPPGQQLPHQMPPGSPIPSHPLSPGGRSLEQLAFEEAQQQLADMLCYRVIAITLAVILLINAIAWFIVYTISAANSEGVLQGLYIGVAVAFASSILTNSCGILYVYRCPSDVHWYLACLGFDIGWMVIVIIFAAAFRFTATAIASSVVIVISIAQWYVDSRSSGHQSECCTL